MNEMKSMLNAYDMMRSMAHQMASSIDPTQFDVATDGANSVNWIVGHLALVADMGSNLLGHPQTTIEQWSSVYGPGSPGGVVGDRGMSRDAVMEYFAAAHDRLRGHADNPDQSLLDAANETPFMSDALPTMGDLLAHVLTTHLGMHTGQISQIRRQSGFDPVFQLPT